MENYSNYTKLFGNFMNSCPLDIEKYANGTASLVLPALPKDLVLSLCSDVGDMLRDSPNMLELATPISVVGDIHGHILDLLRILKLCGTPDKVKYLFLGDIVDRGEFSVETAILVFLMKVLFPENVYIIRGNHEFEFLCTQCGFSTQLEQEFHDDNMLDSFLVTFSYLPISALIDNKILAVHGGIGPSCFSLNQLKKVERPINDFADDYISSILWSDPLDGIEFFQPSTRGTGFFFGDKATNEFVTQNGISMIIRGHECVMSGCEFKFDNQLVTVFSASNYCGLMNNDAGVLIIKNVNQFETKQFPPLKYLKRDNTIFRAFGGSPRRLQRNTIITKSHESFPRCVSSPKEVKLPKLSNLSMIRSNKSSDRLITNIKSQQTVPNIMAGRRNSLF